MLNKEKVSYSPESLINHNISIKLRAKMIDWMVECLATYKMKNSTFFLSVYLLDKFMATTNRLLCKTDIHLLGICCMFMASKHEEIRPMFLDTVQDNIAHNTFTHDEIKKMELEIANTLNFRLSLVTPQAYLEWTEVVFSVVNQGTIVKDILKEATQASKLALIHYDMIQYTPGELAMGSIIFAINHLSDNQDELRNPNQHKAQMEQDIVPGYFDADRLKEVAEKMAELNERHLEICPEFKNILKFKYE